MFDDAVVTSGTTGSGIPFSTGNLISSFNSDGFVVGNKSGNNYIEYVQSTGVLELRGTLDADDITAGTLSVDRLDVDDILAENAEITGTLTIADDGSIEIGDPISVVISKTTGAPTPVFGTGSKSTTSNVARVISSSSTLNSGEISTVESDELVSFLYDVEVSDNPPQDGTITAGTAVTIFVRLQARVDDNSAFVTIQEKQYLFSGSISTTPGKYENEILFTRAGTYSRFRIQFVGSGTFDGKEFLVNRTTNPLRTQSDTIALNENGLFTNIAGVQVKVVGI
jgi:hypothetical protein